MAKIHILIPKYIEGEGRGGPPVWEIFLFTIFLLPFLQNVTTALCWMFIKLSHNSSNWHYFWVWACFWFEAKKTLNNFGINSICWGVWEVVAQQSQTKFPLFRAGIQRRPIWSSSAHDITLKLTQRLWHLVKSSLLKINTMKVILFFWMNTPFSQEQIQPDRNHTLKQCSVQVRNIKEHKNRIRPLHIPF